MFVSLMTACLLDIQPELYRFLTVALCVLYTVHKWEAIVK